MSEVQRLKTRWSGTIGVHCIEGDFDVIPKGTELVRLDHHLAAIAALEAGLKALVDKLEIIIPIVDGYIAFAHVRAGTQYDGPQIVEELAQAKALLPK